MKHHLSPKMQKQRSQALLIFSIATAFVLFQFILQFSSGILSPVLSHEFKMTPVETSLLTGAYYYTYFLMQTPAGYLADRFGARKLLCITTVLVTLSCLLFALSTGPVMAIFARALMGFSISVVFVCSLFLCRNWFPSHIYPLLVAVIEAVGLLCTVLSIIYSASIIDHLGWHVFAYLCVGCAIVFMVLIPIFIFNTPRKGLGQRPLDRINPSAHFWKDVYQLISNPRAVINGCYCAMLITPQTVFIGSWGIPFLISAYKLSLTQATMSSSFLFLGVAFAGPLCGWAYNYLKSPRFFLSAMAILTAIFFFIVIYFTQMNYLLLSGAFFCMGITSNVYLWNYTLIHELEPRVAASTRIGFTNMLAIGVAPFLQIFIGALLGWTNRSHRPGSIHFSIHDYQLSLSILPVLCIVFAGLILFCKYRKN